MNKNRPINIFTKEEDLKFAPYWSKVESYVNNISVSKNIGEILLDAMDEETTRLIWTLQYFVELEKAEKLVYDILIDAASKSYLYTDISDEDLYFSIYQKGLLSLNRCFEKNVNFKKFAIELIEIYIKKFIRLKKGADIFADLKFSDLIITDKLQEDRNISPLFDFMASLGENSFLNDYLEEGTIESEI